MRSVCEKGKMEEREAMTQESVSSCVSRGKGEDRFARRGLHSGLRQRDDGGGERGEGSEKMDIETGGGKREREREAKSSEKIERKEENRKRM